MLDHGKLEWLGETPDVIKARIIVTVMEDQSTIHPRRKAPASIAGKGKTLGDLVESIAPDEDWECLK
jgi:hypothetical protein